MSSTGRLGIYTNRHDFCRDHSSCGDCSMMKTHFITVVLLLIALLFYTLGYSTLGGVAFVIGGVFELWFWVRVFGG